MYEKELRRIIEASQNNALSFFVGAGVSALSGAKLWKELINSICDELGMKRKEDYSSDEYLRIPQIYYYSLGSKYSEYSGFIKRELDISKLLPNQIHFEMLKLNPASIITTNYDSLLEDAAADYCKSFKVVACDSDVPKIHGDRFILKLHGDFKNNNFVLKEEDYLNYSENFKLIETLVKSIFSTNTVVFIGYSLNDYNIKLILNWTKSLLKGEFREPIFIYTGDSELSKEELIYQKSKGLSVIEWNKLSPTSKDFLERYQSVFLAIANLSKKSVDGKDEDEAFEMLYEYLQPLDSLKALRFEDVSYRLFPIDWVGEDGAIYSKSSNNMLLKKFISINQMTNDQQQKLSKDIAKKYQCLSSIFKKARISVIVDENTKIPITYDSDSFADENCILFNYNAMSSFVDKEYKKNEYNYLKAFYLSRLNQYDEAFFAFSQVAKKAFKEGDYLTYYLAEANCISLVTVIKNVNKKHGCYDVRTIELMMPSKIDIENLFSSLPAEFREKYFNLNDIHSSNMLYKYAYEASVTSQKLLNSIDSRTVEFGLTSSGKAINRINDYLHFLLGNGIVVDVFSEYRNAVKTLMSQLLYKYSIQGKETLRDPVLLFEETDDIYFDEIDFYCFIEYFSDKDIKALLSKYEIQTIEFQNMELIERAVENIINYYETATRKTKNNFDVLRIQLQIKCILVLLQHMNISQSLVDRVCSFIFSREFADIRINEKIMFIDSQLGKRKMYSAATSKVIEDTLISYIDRNILAIEKEEKFDVFSTTGINYQTLVFYMRPQEENYVSQRLSLRVTQIITKQLEAMYKDIALYYCLYVSKHKRKELIAWSKRKLCQNFSFDIFWLQVNCKARISDEILTSLKIYLDGIIEASHHENRKSIIVYPVIDPLDDLNQVGYWCLLGILNPKDFEEYFGHSLQFDFFCQYTKFDFSQFDVSWLIKLNNSALERISKSKRVKERIRDIIVKALKQKDIIDVDRQKLERILITYFC